MIGSEADPRQKNPNPPFIQTLIKSTAEILHVPTLQTLSQ